MTQENDLDQFLSTAQLADTSFAAGQTLSDQLATPRIQRQRLTIGNPTRETKRTGGGRSLARKLGEPVPTLARRGATAPGEAVKLRRPSAGAQTTGMDDDHDKGRARTSRARLVPRVAAQPRRVGSLTLLLVLLNRLLRRRRGTV